VGQYGGGNDVEDHRGRRRIARLAGCASTGADHDAPTSQTPPGPASAVQAVAAALAFASQSDPEVGLVDGYASVPPAVQRGQQPIPLASGQANPCAQPPPQRFSASERTAIRAAFHGRTVRFVEDPAGWLGERPPGSLLLVATAPLLGDQRGTVMVLSCVPDPQQVLVTVQWDGRAWHATATGTGKR
jgi:hypothetical protein